MREVRADRLDEGADALADIREGRLFALVVRGVFDPVVLRALCERLERGEDALPRDGLPPAYGFTSRGMCLDMAVDRMPAYHEAARAFDREIGAVVPIDLEARIAQVLTGVSGGRPVGRVRTEAGDPYMALTFRRIAPGGRLPGHWENEHTARGSYQHLLRVIDGAMISVLMPLATPEGGGQVVAHPFPWTGKPHPQPTEAQLAAAPKVTLWPDVGDLVLFDSGRWWHEVVPVQGARPRWTMGGFTAFSPDQRSVWYWS